MSDGAVATRVSPTAVFKRRDFLLLWVAELVSEAGSALTSLAAGLYVYQQTKSALLVGLTLMATAVPSLLVGLVAGVVVDRYDRRTVMILSNLGQALVVAAIPFLIGVNAWLLFVAILLNAGVKQFFDPAHDALVPELASDEELLAANAYLSIASFGSTAIGFAGAGILAAINIDWAFWIDAATFLFSAACILALQTRSKPAAEAGGSAFNVVQNLKAGARTIWDSKMLRSLFLLGAPVFFAFGLWNVLLLPMAIRVLHGTQFQYGLQEGLTSIGFVAGSLFMARYADRLQTGLWVFVGTLGMGIAGVLYGMAPTLWIGILWVTLTGFFNSPSAVSRQTLLQLNTPRELRGRVFASMFVMRDVIFLAGMAGAGLADILPVRNLIVFCSVILVGVAAAALVAPGVGRPAADWRRALLALRAAPVGGIGVARPAALADFELLAARLSAFRALSDAQRAAFVADAMVRDVPEGARVITHGDSATAAYFVLDGETAVGVPEADGAYRDLATIGEGDFFGEIAALTGSARTADVVTTRPSTLLEVPAAALRDVMAVPEVGRLLLSTLNERLTGLRTADLPRLASGDQSAVAALRASAPEAAAAGAIQAEPAG